MRAANQKNRKSPSGAAGNHYLKVKKYENYIKTEFYPPAFIKCTLGPECRDNVGTAGHKTWRQMAFWVKGQACVSKKSSANAAFPAML